MSNVKFWIIVVSVSIGIIALILALTYLNMTWQCNDARRLMPDREFKVVLSTGCMIELESGLWIDADNIRLIEKGNDND